MQVVGILELVDDDTLIPIGECLPQWTAFLPELFVKQTLAVREIHNAGFAFQRGVFHGHSLDYYNYGANRRLLLEQNGAYVVLTIAAAFLEFRQLLLEPAADNVHGGFKLLVERILLRRSFSAERCKIKRRNAVHKFGKVGNTRLPVPGESIVESRCDSVYKLIVLFENLLELPCVAFISGGNQRRISAHHRLKNDTLPAQYVDYSGEKPLLKGFYAAESAYASLKPAGAVRERGGFHVYVVDGVAKRVVLAVRK